MANTTVKNLTAFAYRHNNVLWILTKKLHTETNLQGDYNGLSYEIEYTIDTLKAKYPSLTDLITTHQDPNTVQETPQITAWMAQSSTDVKHWFPDIDLQT